MRALPLLLALAACASNDLGKTCIIRIAPADGGTSSPLLVSQLVDGKTYFASGMPECVTGLCVRDPITVLPTPADAGDIAYGYCTQVCQTVGTGCADGLTCRTFFDPFLGSPNLCMH